MYVRVKSSGYLRSCVKAGQFVKILFNHSPHSKVVLTIAFILPR